MAERDWIKTYFAPIADSAAAAELRDDVALLGDNPSGIVTVDALVETVHFLPSDPIETIARKLVRTNVSDILAKGALPRQALLTLGWPSGRPEAELEAFAIAFGDELSAWNVSLIGGDTVRAPSHLFLSLTLTGECVGNGPVRRSTAQVDDEVWVSGTIGRSGLGLSAARANDESSQHLAYYRTPEIPKIEISEVISRYGTAAMDVSDGLLRDVLTLAEASEVGAHIMLEKVPFPAGTGDLAAMLAAVTAGDDYQILFTASPEASAEIERYSAEMCVNLTKIGRLNADFGLKVTENGRPVNLPETLGFEHG